MIGERKTVSNLFIKDKNYNHGDFWLTKEINGGTSLLGDPW